MNADNNTTAQLIAGEPAQIVQAFLAAYDPDQVQLMLLAVLQGYALNEQKGFLDIDINEGELALLFDNLIELIAVLRQLTDQGKISGIPERRA